MKKKRIVIFLSIFLLIGLGFVGLQSFKNKMSREIESYLIDQKGYSEIDISKIYTQVGMAPVVSTTVIFNDDKSSRYFYRKENGRIYQYSMAPVHGVDDGHKLYKHKEN